MSKVFHKLVSFIIIAFVLIFIVSTAIIGISYYRYFEGMMADKLNQSVSVASYSYVQSFFDTIKREAVQLVKEEPLKSFLDGSTDAESSEDFLRYRTDVSVSEYIEVYSGKTGKAISYDEQGDFFNQSSGNPNVDFSESDCLFLPVNVVTKDGQAQQSNTARHYTLIYQKIADDGSYIATGLSAHVTRSGILSGLILPKTVSYTDIRNGVAENTDSNMYLINGDGVVLCDYFLQFAGQSLAREDFYANFEKSQFDDDHHVVSYNESSYIMSCSYQSKPGMYVLGVIQKRDILAAILPTLVLLAVLILISLSIFCFLCILLLYKAFAPYDKLVKKVSETSHSSLEGADLLGEVIEKGAAAEQKAHEKALDDYILDREVDLEALSEIEQQYPGNYLPVICQVADNDAAPSGAESLQVCREVLESAFSACGKTLFLSIDKNKLLLILCGAQPDTDISERLIECQNTVLQRGITPSYIIGKTQAQLKNIKDSYDSMQKTLFMSVCFGEASILTDVLQEDSVEFSSGAVATIISSINTGDKEKITRQLDQIFDDFSGKKSSLITIYLLQITLGIISHIASFSSNQTLFDYREIIDKVTGVSSLPAAKKIISQLCFDACDYLTPLQKKANGKQEVETKILKYLQENYNDPNLSLTFISNKFGYSPKYLGRIFKNYTDQFFTQYLSDLRMEKARELIVNSDKPISEICESVGITTLQSFYRLFKKQYGYTPAAMRKNLLDEQKNS